jgi:hypothetical protein
VRKTAAFVPAVAILVGAGVIYLSRGESDCEAGSREAAKRVADAFVSALVRQERERAHRYLSSDADAVRRNLPRVSTDAGVLSSILRRARSSTVEACGKGFLELAGARSRDPCFVYPLTTTGGGWLRGRKRFRDADFRVVLGCEGDEWRVKGTLRIA